MNRRIVFLLFGVVCTTTNLFGGEAKITWDQHSLAIEVPELAELVNGTIVGTNQSDEPVELTDAKASCGCIILSNDIRQTIVPGGKATISFELHVSSGEKILHKQIILTCKSKDVTYTDTLSLVVQVPEVVHLSETRFQIYRGLQQYKVDLEIKGNHILRNVEVNCGRGEPLTGSFVRLGDKRGLITFAVPENSGYGTSIVCTIRIVLDDWKDLVDYVVFDR